MSEQTSTSPYVRGFRIAADGMKVAVGSADVRRAYLKVVAVIFVLSLAISSGSIWALWANTAPAVDAALWLVVTMWVVRVVGVVVALLIGPLLAIFTVNIAFPFFNEGVFMAGLRVLDPDRAAALAAKQGMPLGPAMGIATWRLIKFLGLSLCFLLIGLIPVVGTIAGTLGELWLAARTVSWELLDPYFGCLDIRHAEQREIVGRHQKALLGFGLPISLMLAIPIAGPLLFGFAQVAGAAFVAKELPVDPRERPDQGALDGDDRGAVSRGPA
ncbi:Etoposide-induced protein [Enhygromyxa salina]|uniref:Etoposide-induced protein n=1 Tax=Enhygromyxa salina TaxID=215803 RepID=A0A2S9XB94_9BACT|nr:EI24 domain-containing protein [Enhygromyxa salina]PRP90123.1 Etoposide-induced protein [Enhygromyxa salina]